MNPNDIAPLIGGSFFMLCVSAVAITAMVLRARRARGELPGGATPQVEERLRSIERAVDAIAIEVERISEGQRFTTKLLADRLKDPALASGREAGGASGGRM